MHEQFLSLGHIDAQMNKLSNGTNSFEIRSFLTILWHQNQMVAHHWDISLTHDVCIW